MFICLSTIAQVPSEYQPSYHGVHNVVDLLAQSYTIVTSEYHPSFNEWTIFFQSHKRHWRMWSWTTTKRLSTSTSHEDIKHPIEHLCRIWSCMSSSNLEEVELEAIFIFEFICTIGHAPSYTQTTCEDVTHMHTWSCRHIHTNNIGGCGAGGHNSYAQLVLQTHTHHTHNNLGGCGAGGHNSYAQLVLQTHTHKQHWRMWSWRSQLICTIGLANTDTPHTEQHWRMWSWRSQLICTIGLANTYTPHTEQPWRMWSWRPKLICTIGLANTDTPHTEQICSM